MIGGVTAVRDGDGWVLRQFEGAPLGRLVHAGDGLRIEDGANGMPAGPYGSVDAAVEAVETWASARFDGERG